MTGVIGNVTTCVVIARNSYMHTATNYYLFSLAISDMLSAPPAAAASTEQIERDKSEEVVQAAVEDPKII